jgi:phage terminase large subunit-like protein
MNNHTATFFKLVNSPFKFRMMMWKILPSAWFAGLRVDHADEKSCSVSVSYKWFNKNPFRSTYFAILSMAAELSTGVLCMAALYKREKGISMLVVKSEATFLKKAVGKTVFTFADGDAFFVAVEKTLATGEGVTIPCKTIGKNEAGEVVAEFIFVWSIKAKK